MRVRRVCVCVCWCACACVCDACVRAPHVQTTVEGAYSVYTCVTCRATTADGFDLFVSPAAAVVEGKKKIGRLSAVAVVVVVHDARARTGWKIVGILRRPPPEALLPGRCARFLFILIIFSNSLLARRVDVARDILTASSPLSRETATGGRVPNSRNSSCATVATTTTTWGTPTRQCFVITLDARISRIKNMIGVPGEASSSRVHSLD